MDYDFVSGVDRVTVWRCIGCGRIEAPQPCIGVCSDRKAELVHAQDYAALAEHVEGLAAIAREIATITPRAGEWERSYRALQERARRALKALADSFAAKE